MNQLCHPFCFYDVDEKEEIPKFFVQNWINSNLYLRKHLIDWQSNGSKRKKFYENNKIFSFSSILIVKLKKRKKIFFLLENISNYEYYLKYRSISNLSFYSLSLSLDQFILKFRIRSYSYIHIDIFNESSKIEQKYSSSNLLSLGLIYT